MIKAAFFDVDGTLLNSSHKMLESTKQALAQLQANGIRTVLATGRGSFELPPCIKGRFDSYICFNGQLCFDNEGDYRDCPIDPQDVNGIIGAVEAGIFDVYALTRTESFLSHANARTEDFATKLGLSTKANNISRLKGAAVYQFCAIVDTPEEHLVREAATHVRTTRWTPLFCDVIPEEGGKGTGIVATFERYGIAPEEAIAFGDGENDLTMFDECGCSVAMGNAWDLVRERADYVTDDMDNDGIWNACKHFGLI